jgi:general secretion pathway protein H
LRRVVLQKGMTLIELVLVMALLAVLLSVSAPWLSRFFAGRGLEEEARQMLALTRYARSQAITSGVPMELWVDTKTNSCGVDAQTGYGIVEQKPVEFQLAEGLSFNADNDALDENGRTKIVFSPEGTVSEDGPQSVVIQDTREGRERKMEIALADDGLHFEIGNVDSETDTSVASKK